MKRNTKRNPQNSSDNMVSSILIGGGIGIAVCILAVLIIPTVLLNFEDPNSLTFIASTICLALGAITAAVTASSKSKTSKTLSGFLASIIVFVPILLFSFFISGDFGVINIITTAAIITISGFVCSYLINKLSSDSNKKMKKIMKGR